MSDLDPVATERTPRPDPAPASPTPTHEVHQLHPNASKCTLSANSNSHLNTPGATRALTEKHRIAIDMSLAGEDDYAICFRLKIDRSTLYRWRHHNPLFIAETNRRHQEVWSDFAAELRLSVAKAVRALNHQVDDPNAVNQHRAARTLIQLVNSQRIAPTQLPTRVDDVLDNFLRAAQPLCDAPPPKDTPAPTFTDAQRHALLDRLLTEEAAAESALQAAAAQRRALHHQRRQQHAQQSTPDNEPRTMDNTPRTTDNGQLTTDQGQAPHAHP